MTWFVLAMLAITDVSAMAEREVAATSVVLLSIDENDAPVEVADRIVELMDSGTRVALAGAPEVLATARPGFIHAWPGSNTVVLDPGTSLGVSGFNAGSDTQRDEVLRQWAWAGDVLTYASAPAPRHDGSTSHGRRHVEFSVLATTPSAVCRSFSTKMAAALFGDAAPTASMKRAFRREVRRWCQYGTLSAHSAEPPQFTIEPFATTDEVRLSLGAEWALIRNEHIAGPGEPTYLFWVRTTGDGAGTGFSRRHGMDGWYDPATRMMTRLLDAAIHSGWGPIESRDVVTAWPLNSSFPAVGNIHAFRCDAPRAFRPYECPFAPMLRRLYPEDSHDGTVTVSLGQSMSFAGEAGLTRTTGTDGAALHLNLGVSAHRSEALSAQIASSLVDIRSNGDTSSYRSTWWRPDVPAIQRWIDARTHSGSLVKATALASTLNPRHELVWELPLDGNRQRDLSYHVIYEAGWNTCISGTHCKDYRRFPMPAIPAKARVGWSDGIVLRLPAR